VARSILQSFSGSGIESLPKLIEITAMRLFRFNMISYLSIVLILVVAPGDIQAVEPPANPNVIVMVSDNGRRR